MADIKDFGVLTLGSYLRKVSDALYREVDEVYGTLGFEHSSRVVPCLLLVKENGQIPISILAEKLGQTHSAVSQMSKKLLSADLIFDVPDASDERRRLVSLTPLGYEYLDRIDRALKHIKSQLNLMLDGRGEQLIQLLTHFELEHGQLPLSARVLTALAEDKAKTLTIVDFEPRFRETFKSLNIEWLDKYFYVEEIDEKVLSNPEDYIIAHGGHIFIALLDEQPVGTVALIKADAQRLELSKMAVTESAQGYGIGRKLLKRAIAFFQQSNFSELFLESNSKLTTAIQLYESEGFEHRPNPAGNSHYQRANVYMEYTGK